MVTLAGSDPHWSEAQELLIVATVLISFGTVTFGSIIHFVF